MLTVLTFLWHDPEGRHNAIYSYGPEYVNRMASMLRRNLSRPFEMICLCDRLAGIGEDCLALPLPTSRHLPDEYRKLWAFHRGWRGRRVLMLDLDLVLTGPIDDLIDRPELFVAWSAHPNSAPGRFNTSVVLMDGGAFPEVMDRFDGKTSIEALRALGYEGWEQDWISYVIGDRGATWARSGEGIESFKAVEHRGIDEQTRIVSFNGNRSPATERAPWIAEHWK